MMRVRFLSWAIGQLQSGHIHTEGGKTCLKPMCHFGHETRDIPPEKIHYMRLFGLLRDWRVSIMKSRTLLFAMGSRTGCLVFPRGSLLRRKNQ